MLDFLDQNAGSLTVLFTPIVTLSTVVYALLTGILVAETRRMRQAQTEPKIEIMIKPWEGWINIVRLCVRNIGLGPAYDITFKIHAEAGADGAQALIDDFTRASFFNTGLKYLGPSQYQESAYSQLTDKFDQKIASVLVFDVRYRNANTKWYEEKFRLDFSEFEGQTQIGRPHLYAIAKHLEGIERDLHNVATGFKRIGIDTYNRQDREQERDEWEEHRQQSMVRNKESNESKTERKE